jgi:TRAP-type transport system periplasmic protein
MRGMIAIVLVAVSLFAASSEAAGETFRLKAHHLMVPVAAGHRAMLVPWAEKVERDAGGRIRIDIYPSMHLGGQPPALIDQARDGIVDIVWTLPGYTPGRFPRIEVFELPFMNADPAVMNHAMQAFIENHPEEFADYKVISLFVHAGQVIHSRVPVRSVDDLRGMKIRIPTRVAGWMVESWSAVPVGTPVGKIPEVLSKGVVDAALIPFEGSFGLRVHELVNYHTMLDSPASNRFNTQVLIIAMNRASYARLPPDLQSVIDENSGANIASWVAEVWTAAEAPGEEAALASSGELIYLPPHEVTKMRERSERQVRDRWIREVARRGLDGDALVEEALALIARFRREHQAEGLVVAPPR